jgi:hypothetical protein
MPPPDLGASEIPGKIHLDALADYLNREQETSGTGRRHGQLALADTKVAGVKNSSFA